MRAARSDRRKPLRGLLSARVIALSVVLAGGGLVLLCAPASSGRSCGRDGPTADYGFHRTTGVRQRYRGVMICVVWETDRARALGVLLTTLGSIPVADAVIALGSGSPLSPRSRRRRVVGARPMNVLVCGATGATGHELVSQALAQGHRVTAFVRTPATLGALSTRVTVAQGDVADAAAVAHARDGQSAVLSALGAASPLRRDPGLVEGVRHIVDAMEQMRVRRLVSLSFLGVPAGRRPRRLVGRTLVARLLLRHVVADHAVKEEIIQRSRLDWVLVRPPRLTNGPRHGSYRHGSDIRATSIVPTIARADLADFMLRQLADDTYVRRAPAVMLLMRPDEAASGFWSQGESRWLATRSCRAERGGGRDRAA